MNQVITITFNPAIDKSTTIRSLLPEKKLACTPPVFEPGGGGINVARAIKKLGGRATAIYFSGGYTGKFLSQLIEKEGILSVNIPIKEHTRENLVVKDISTNQQYRFGMPGPEVTAEEWSPCMDLLKKCAPDTFIVVSGSLPPGMPPSIMGEIALIAKQQDAKLIVDTSSDGIKQALKEGVYLLKPNLAELAALTGCDNLMEDEIAAAARSIIRRRQSTAVVVSLGASGAILVTHNEQVLVPAPIVKSISTVGAGDSMVAGMVMKLANGAGFLSATRYGIACGTAATLNPGTALCKKEDVDKLYQLVLNNAAVTMSTW
jgi:6-phosphofructokinase 2